MVRLHLNLSTDPQFNAWLTEFQAESDRAAGVLGPAYLDFLLREMLLAAWVDDRKRFVDFVESPTAPLGSFGPRIRLLHAIGMIADDEATDLDSVRDIRNFFAHELHASFEKTQKLASRCKGFLLARERMDAEEGLAAAYGEAPPRRIFDLEVALLAYYLTRRLAHVKRFPKPEPALWPRYDLGHEKRP